jgi:hypothetical protein
MFAKNAGLMDGLFQPFRKGRDYELRCCLTIVR